MSGGKVNSSYYPLFLNLKSKYCVVVGGGEVALRKIKSLLDYGARVIVISPSIHPDIVQLAESKTVTLIKREYKPGDLKSSFLAIVATADVKTNEIVAEEAKNQGILVNVVDSPLKSDFILPSYFHRGNLTIAVSTAGKSPALARRIRKKLEQELGEEYGFLTKLVSEVRSELKRRGLSVSNDAWQKALNLDELIPMVRDGQIEEVKITLLRRLEEAGK